MKAPISIEKLSLEGLLHFIEKNSLSIPEFQRGYVWREKQVKSLFDSLVNRYPVGSFIIWKTNQRIGARGLFVKETKNSKQKYFVLDGQQRLLSIFYLCKQSSFLKVKSLFEEVYEHKEKYLLEFEHFFIDKKRKPELAYLKDKNQDFDLKYFKKQLGSNYLFPLIIIDINDYAKAIEVFERINQAGTAISTESIFLSEAWNKKTSLGKVLRKWRNQNKNTICSKLDTIIFIHTLAMILQLEKIGFEKNKDNNIDISVKRLKKIAVNVRNANTKVYEKEFSKTLKAINNSTSFLSKEFNIKRISDLPSQTIVSMLAVFFYYCEDDPTKNQRKELKKWFWRASLGSRYVGAGYTENIKKDAPRMKELAKNKKALNIERQEFSFDDLLNTDMHTGRSAVKNSIKLMLWKNEPVWINGEKINQSEVESTKKKKEDDHFYPYNIYQSNKEKIEENKINSILNLCYLPKTENASKQKDLPSKWLSLRRKELKSKKSDEKLFFTNNLLPFRSIKDLRLEETGLENKNGKIKPRNFNRHFERFLKQRAKLFTKELNRVQKGS